MGLNINTHIKTDMNQAALVGKVSPIGGYVPRRSEINSVESSSRLSFSPLLGLERHREKQ